ncbi:mucin-3A-like [Ylistrum balloti]|uniref:mucin-3A-like n=1 Tax=Ylistrum balloti TaxID=509963 RepID=UPI0029058D69|nr:mucin-3A-like [Ylistrum balloti]
MKTKFFTFTFRFLISTFDLIIDWLLLYEVIGIEQGLVFGPFPESASCLLILFSCIGTVTYIAELVLNIVDFVVEKDDFLPAGLLDNVNLVSLWVEDVPLIMMSVYMAGCRDAAVTILLLVKAFSTLLEVFVNVGIIIAKYNIDRTRTVVAKFDEKKPSRWLKIPLFISLVLMVIGSTLVFSLGSYFTDSKNVIQLPSSLDFSYETYKGMNYLQGSGVYMNFDLDQPGVVTMTSEQWMSLLTLENIRSAESQPVLVRVTYDSNPNTWLWIQSTSSDDLTSPELSICYSTQSSPMSVLTTCSDDLQMTSNATSIVFKFVYKSPSNSKPLGDLYYNYGVSSPTNIESCNDIESAPSFSLRYFKVTSNLNDISPLLFISDVSGEYYKTGVSLNSVPESGKTGLFECGCTGKSVPEQDKSISIPCLQWNTVFPISSTIPVTSPTPVSTITRSKPSSTTSPTTTPTPPTTQTTSLSTSTTPTTPVTTQTHTTTVTSSTTSTTPTTIPPS